MRGTVISLGTAALLAVSLGSGPAGTTDDGLLLVANKSGNTLSFVEPGTGAELAVVPTGPSPHEVAVTPDGRWAFVADYGGNTLTVVDVAAREVADTVDLGAHTQPHGITSDRAGTSIWVTTEGSRHLVEVDVATREVKRAIRTGQEVTHMVVLAETKGKAYTANIGSGNVTAIDIREGAVISQIPTGAGAEGLALTPDEEHLLVTNRSAGTVSIVDVARDSVIHSLEVGGFPIRVEVTPDGRTALVSRARAGNVLEIEIGTWRPGRSIDVGRVPVGIEVRPDGQVAYVANTQDDLITLIDLEAFQEAGTLTAGAEPDGMAWVSGSSSS